MSQVTGGLRGVLRLEGLSLLALSLYLYHTLGYSWLSFAVFILLPDLSFTGYLLSPKLGAIFYNLAHSLVGACCLLLLGEVLSHEALRIGGLIWVAHIGFDRALGYGLKSYRGFAYTHLGVIGNAQQP